MARLLVKLHGEDVSRLTLEDGVEYIAGRSADANIVLSGERGISRHHLKFYQRDGAWVCESLSKFMLIQKGGASVEVVELGEACVFSVPPYEFYFESGGAMSESPGRGADAAPKENLPVFYQPRVNGGTTDDTSAGQGPRANNEATVAGVAATLVPYLRISFPNTADDEVLKLEGHLWVAGRDPNCEIPIDSPHVSRKHFELARTADGFFITDLGSSNGTLLNGQGVPPHEPTRIDSGDELSVKSITMIFEIRDAAFKQRVGALPMPAFDPGLAAPPVSWHPPTAPDIYEDYHAPRDEPPPTWKQIRPRHLKNPAVRKRVVRMTLFVMLPLLLGGILMPSKPKGIDRNISNKEVGNTSVSFEKLTNEQRSVVKDSFNLARNLYVQGKYELCLTELAKLHELIPLFENSKELQSFCEQGRELVHRQRDLERKERERQAIESQIAGYVESCETKLKKGGSVEETRQCLADAMELDPEHHLIVEMLHAAQIREEERKFLAQQKASTNRKAAQGVAHYQKAKALFKSGSFYKAQFEYDRFLNATYPHDDGIKSTARRELAAIKKQLKTKVSTLIEQCKSLGGKGQYKEAYKACDRAIGEDPDNEAAKSERGHMQSELKRELKAIYEDSVLEESLGNVDIAKDKWKKIVAQDLEKGEYGLKAKSKLQKYGIGN